MRGVSARPGNAIMGVGGVVSFFALAGMATGGGLNSVELARLLLGTVIFVVGQACKTHSVDLLYRQDGDFSPPDPLLKEIPVLGPLFYRIAARDIRNMEAAYRRGESERPLDKKGSQNVPLPGL